LAPLWICFVVLAVLTLFPSAIAQQSEPKNSESEGEPRYEIFGGYSYKREDGHNLHGWTGTFIVNVNRWFAVASDVDGHYGSHREGAEDVSVHEYAFTFGPHVALRNGSRVTPFAFALFGGAHETVKTAGVPESATSFAANLGGGFDVHINHRVSVRVIQVDAAYTRFHGEGKTSPRFSTGLVISFGKMN
jgi:hypothetical protein